MGSWVDDFTNFKSESGGLSVITPSKSRAGSSSLLKQQTRAEKIKAELKLLEWHKLANDSAIKAALMQTKILKEDTDLTSESNPSMSAMWMKQVLDDENNKPLEVSKDFIIKFEHKEKETQEKLTNQMERHISTLKMLRSKLEEQSELQARQESFRTWNKDFKQKKSAVLTGKTLTEIAIESSSGGSNTGPGTSFSRSKMGSQDLGSYSGRASMVGTGGAYPGSGVGHGRELSTVLESLTKLAELERRISSLEKDNGREDEDVSLEDGVYNPVVNKHTTLEFRKKRTAGGLKESVRSVFAVREKKQAWLPADPLMKRKKPQPAAVYGAPRPGVKGPTRGRTFLTERDDYGDVDDEREMARKERARMIAMAPAGQKELRSRILLKKERNKIMATGAQRHEMALQHMQQRRTEKLVKAKPAPRVMPPVKGASSGVKHKNKHLQEFENIKKAHARRLESQVMVSKTVPAPRSKPMQSAPRPPQRMPATQVSGTVTRRSSSVPQRRVPSVAVPVVAGAGITGVRGLRAMK